MARINLKRGKGEEKMTTLEDVVKMWDKTHPNSQTETLKGKNIQPGGKIKSGHFLEKHGGEAVIKLSSDYPYEPWDKRTCYVFTSNYDENNNHISIRISFQRRVKEHPNTQAFYDFLNKIINNNKNFTVSKGRINPNHLVLKRVFPLKSSAQVICKGMEELIKLTQKPICDFLAGKNKEKLPAKRPLAKNKQKIFSDIMKKYGIEKNENKKLYDKCEEIYIQTIKILENLHIGSEDADEFLKVSYYTKKSIAQKLLIASKGENKYDKFRLYYTHGMNDPHEGKTLLQFLGIEDEDLKLPETLPFIACFSFEVNSLNQFRLYGKENNEEATGVSIVFNFNFFNDDINEEQGKYQLYHCVYIDPYSGKIESISFSKKDEKENQEKIENRRNEMEVLFEDLKKKIQALLNINVKINKHELAKDLLINIRYLIKHYAFMEERECRIIDMKNKEDHESIDIEDGRLYITTDEIKNYVDKIYFGPLAEGIEGFRLKIKGIKCEPSRHPFKSKRQ
ncbi:MAG: DUF2971 domain-containing protein [Candidatus Fibromonas sp.]|nr:DUF2971 domain-containing protein [Candidatus Fibromonas sp.]